MTDGKLTQRSKKWIYESLIELMKKRPFSKITIQNITENADVARLTFYRNFKSKEDVIIEKAKSIIQNINYEIHNTNFVPIDILCNAFIDNSDFFKIVIGNDLEYLITKAFDNDIKEIFRKVFDLNFIDQYTYKYYIGSFSSIVMEYFRITNSITISGLREMILRYFDKKSFETVNEI
jgi:AcrR family transcriptional regulator